MGHPAFLCAWHGFGRSLSDLRIQNQQLEKEMTAFIGFRFVLDGVHLAGEHVRG